MSPKGKQARQSQRKKAENRLNLLQQGSESPRTTGCDSTPSPKNLKNKKRPRETEQEEGQTPGTEPSSQHQNKRNQALPDSEGGSEGSGSSEMDTSEHRESRSPQGSEDEQKTDSGQSGKGSNEVNTTKTPPLNHIHWEQIMARFDSFEKSIQSTIKEEIKVNSTQLQKQMKSLNNKVKEVEGGISTNKNEIAKINQKVSDLNDRQGNIQTIVAAEIQKQVSERVASLEKDLEDSKQEIDKLKKIKSNPPQNSSQSGQVSRQEFLLEKCFVRKRNLMLMGMEECKEGEDDKSKAAGLLQTRLNIPRVKLEMALRMGAPGGKYPRPTLITFSDIGQRYHIWYKKGELNKDQSEKLWLQEDLPKPLRADMNALVKIQKKAKSIPEKYPGVKIKDFKIRIQGQYYNAQELELLPDDLKPSRNATPRNDNAVVFFGRASPLSNHHLCSFKIAGRVFTCIEHFLAWQRANIAEDKTLADEVLTMKDPSEHKKILNSLREKNPNEWEDTVENILLTALRAKFQQNPHLKKFLCDTSPRRIGEASQHGA